MGIRLSVDILSPFTFQSTCTKRRGRSRVPEKRIEITELIFPEIFSRMGIAYINCMHGNGLRAINQNKLKAVDLMRILPPFVFTYR